LCQVVCPCTKASKGASRKVYKGVRVKSLGKALESVHDTNALWR